MRRSGIKSGILYNANFKKGANKIPAMKKKSKIKKQKKEKKREKKPIKLKPSAKEQLQKEFGYCEICGKQLKEVDYDTPLYCEECIVKMENMDIDPESYKKYFASVRKEQK